MAASAVLFDIDGTLVDSNFLHVEAWSHAFHDLHLAVGAWKIQRAIGADSSELLAMLLPDEPDGIRDRAKRLHSTYYRALHPRIEVISGTRELVAELASRGLRVVLATSAPADELEALLEELDLDAYLYATTTAEDVDKAKPEPDLILRALSKGKVPAANAVMVGDSVWDVRAAVNAGVASIALMSGGTDGHTLLREGAVAVYEDVADLHRHIDDASVARYFTAA